MMTHAVRRRVLGGAIVLAIAAVVAATAPAPLAAGMAAVLTGAGLLVAVGPHAVRTVRAWHARHSARRAQQTPAASPVGRTAGAVPDRQRGLARLLVACIAAAVAAVAAVAVVLNYAHGVDVAHHNAEPTWRALLYPLPADGLLVASSLVLVWQLLATNTTTWRPRIGFALGIAASAGTNVLAALHAHLAGAALAERIVWTTWPTLGLLAAHEMLLLMLTHYAVSAFGSDVQNQPAGAVRVAAEDRALAAETELASVRDQLTQHQEAAADRAREVAELQSDLDHLTVAGTERTMDDWADLRALVPALVQQHRATGRPVVGADVARVLGVSVRWAQKHMSSAERSTRADRRELAAASI